MKNQILTLFVIIVLISCKKEVDNGLEPIVNSHRVKKLINYDNSKIESSSTTFIYEGEQLIKQIHNSNNEITSQWEFNYENSKITGVQSLYNTNYYGNWMTWLKDEFVLENQNLIETIRYRNSTALGNQVNWQLEYKKTYQYKSNKIISWQFLNVGENETFILTQRGEFVYEGNKLVEYKGFDTNGTENMVQNEKILYTYSGEKINEIKLFYLDENGNEVQDTEVKYYYTNDEISNIVQRQFDNEKDYWIVLTVEYKYDDNGYLIEEIYDEGNSIAYEYEEGNGNARMLLIDPLNFTLTTMPRLKNAILNNSTFPSVGFSLF